MEPDARPIDIHRKIVELIDDGRPLAVATVLSTEGSTPQRVGAKAAIDAAGHLWGTVGGGAVEAEATRIALEACRSQRPVVFDFRMEGDDAAGAGAICGGRMRLLVDPTVARHRSGYAAAADALERRERGVLLTTIRIGAQELSTTLPFSDTDRRLAGSVAGGEDNVETGQAVGMVAPPDALTLTLSQRERGPGATLSRPTFGRCPERGPLEVQVEWLAEDAIARRTAFPDGRTIQTCLEKDRPQRFVETLSGVGQVANLPETGQIGNLPHIRSLEVFIEPIIPRPLLLIAGGGHVGQALAVQAIQIGFDVAVIDDRPEFADPALFPRGVKVCCGSVPQQIAAHRMDKDTYVVIVTRGHRQDAEALAACIYQRPAYLGMIGSRRKVALMRKSFLESGLATKEELDRVYAPIGLTIGAVTVPEIAVSIAAQLIAVRRGIGRDPLVA